MRKNAYPIRTESDYQAALELVAPYFDNEPEVERDAGAHFEAMDTLIETFEAAHYPIDPPDPIEAIKFRMEQQGLKPKDMEPMIGQRKRYEKALSHYNVIPVSTPIAAMAAQRRAQYRLTLPDAIQLATGLDIGAAAFVTHDRVFCHVTGVAILTGDQGSAA